MLTTLLSICFSISIYAIELTISAPGLYKLGDNLTVFPALADTVINITSSDVIFDMNGYFIAQGNITGNVDCFVVNSNLSDITIKNGTIRDISRNGILVNQSCTRINVRNIRFENCGATGITLAGTAGNLITVCQIDNCQFYGCSNGAFASSVINLTRSNEIKINKVVIANTAAATSLSMIGMDTCILNDLSNINIENNAVTLQFIAILDLNGAINKYSDITIRNNSSGGAFDFIGCNFLTVNANTVSNLNIILNVSPGGNFVGFNLSDSDNCRFTSCFVEGNSGATRSSGFDFINNGNQNILSDCLVIANSSSGVGAQTVGYDFNNGNREVLRCCYALNNSSINGTAIGAFLHGGGGTGCSFVDCNFNRNNGAAAASSLGVLVAAPSTSNLFTRTIAFNNNTTPGNQLNGVPVGSVQTPAAPATSNLNTLSSPWANLALGS